MCGSHLCFGKFFRVNFYPKKLGFYSRGCLTILSRINRTAIINPSWFSWQDGIKRRISWFLSLIHYLPSFSSFLCWIKFLRFSSSYILSLSFCFFFPSLPHQLIGENYRNNLRCALEKVWLIGIGVFVRNWAKVGNRDCRYCIHRWWLNWIMIENLCEVFVLFLCIF